MHKPQYLRMIHLLIQLSQSKLSPDLIPFQLAPLKKVLMALVSGLIPSATSSQDPQGVVENSTKLYSDSLCMHCPINVFAGIFKFHTHI